MTHEEIEAYGYGNEIIFKNLEEKIMTDIVRKIKTAGDLSGSTVYLMEQLSYMGYDVEQIKKLVQEALEESEEYVDSLYDEVLEHEYLGASPIFQAKGKEMIPFKQNPVMQNLLSFAKSSTNGEMKNMTQSLGFVKKTIDGTKAVELTKFYQETMDKALMEVATGTFSLDRALNDAVNVMVNSGVRWIDYESGHHNRIAVAARRSVMSGLANASQEQTLNMAKELDIHTFEVSAHMGARPTHAEWQGKVYTDEELVSVCGLGEVTGLLGANCYHNYYMFFKGVSKRAYTDEQLEEWKNGTPTAYNGKEYSNYEARQRMRQMETNMRAQKEKIKLLEKGGASKEVIQSAQARYRKQMSEYERFADAMNMKTQKNRITIGDGKTMKGVKTFADDGSSRYMSTKARIIGEEIVNLHKQTRIVDDDSVLELHEYALSNNLKIKDTLSTGTSALKFLKSFGDANGGFDGIENIFFSDQVYEQGAIASFNANQKSLTIDRRMLESLEVRTKVLEAYKRAKILPIADMDYVAIHEAMHCRYRDTDHNSTSIMKINRILKDPKKRKQLEALSENMVCDYAEAIADAAAIKYVNQHEIGFRIKVSPARSKILDEILKIADNVKE